VPGQGKTNRQLAGEVVFGWTDRAKPVREGAMLPLSHCGL